MATAFGFVRGPLQPTTDQEADEDLLYTLEEVGVHVAREARNGESGEREDWGQGTLRLTSRRLLWNSEPRKDAIFHKDAMPAFSLDMIFVGLHAATRDPDTFPEPCLYTQLLLDQFPPSPDHPAELFFLPRNTDKLSELFEFMSKAAALNPDEDNEFNHDDHLITADDTEESAQQILERFDDLLSVPVHLQSPL